MSVYREVKLISVHAQTLCLDGLYTSDHGIEYSLISLCMYMYRLRVTNVQHIQTSRQLLAQPTRQGGWTLIILHQPNGHLEYKKVNMAPISNKD